MKDYISKIPDLLKYVHKEKLKSLNFNYIMDDKWINVSCEEFLDHIRCMVLGLHSLGIKKGDRVGICAHSDYEWILIDLGIMSMGAVTVPFFEHISPNHMSYELAQTQLKMMFTDCNCEQFDNQVFMVIDLRKDRSDIKGLTLADVLTIGKNLGELKPNLFQELQNEVDENDLASIVYTSGSTGIPKGVMLSQKSIIHGTNEHRFYFEKQAQKFLSILPLAHVFARSCHYIMMANGASIYFSNDMSKLGEQLKKIKPTILIVVPRLIERIYTKILANIQELTFFKRTLSKWALSLAHREDSIYKKIFLPLANRHVFANLRKLFGNNIYMIISGGSPINPKLSNFFYQIGIPIYEGWGLTETAGPASCNFPANRKNSSVGLLFKNFELKLSSEGEILLRGSGVMQGYYENEIETNAALDSEGWLHTGDRGAVDAKGFITIIGRIKEFYKTSTGKYVSPTVIEQHLVMVPFIDKAVVIAENRPCVTCLIFPDFEGLKSVKAKSGFKTATDEDFLHSKEFNTLVDTYIKSVNEKLDTWEQIRAYKVINKALSVEHEELTVTLKIRRAIIDLKYKDVIEEMYNECEEKHKYAA